MLDENANFSGHSAASRPHGKDWHSSLQRSKKTYNRTFSELCSEEPCRCLGNSYVFKNTHPHLFDVAGSKDACGDNMLRVSARAKGLRLYGTSLDIND